MKNLTQKESRILEMLRFDKLRGKEIGFNLNLPANEVSRIISNIRKKFVKGNANASYIFATKQGYTLEETPENLRYEGVMRLKKGTSMILNGKHVFNRCRQLDLSSFNSLSIEFYPKTTTISNELQRQEK